jgi:hypothetical protein
MHYQSINHATTSTSNDTNKADNDTIINSFQSLQANGPALLQVDIMGMLPLDMIKQLYCKNTEAAVA